MLYSASRDGDMFSFFFFLVFGFLSELLAFDIASFSRLATPPKRDKDQTVIPINHK